MSASEFRFDPISQDPESTDRSYPATLAQVTFDSHGSQLNGALYVAQGEGPHRTVLLLHGFPGVERNFDLAHTIRRAGWNVLVFHYRGSWGSQGNYAFQHVLEDAHAALAFLRSEQAVSDYRIDPDHITLIGHSLGGFIALMTAAADSKVQAAASIAGVNFGPFVEGWKQDETIKTQVLQFFEDCLPPLQGTSATQLFDEIIQHGEDWNLLTHVPSLLTRPILLIGAEHDEDVPVSQHHQPLVKAFEEAKAEHLTYHVLETDHAFSNRRVALARQLLDWLLFQPRFLKR